MAKKNNKVIKLSILSLLLGIVIGAGSSIGVTTFTYSEEINAKNNETINSNVVQNTGEIYSELQIHFLELGNKYAGDCTYIKAGDTDILIDAGSRADSVKTIKKYVDQFCTDNKLEYVIATHAHQDHIAALVGNKNNKFSSRGGRDGILNQYDIGTLIYFSKTNNETGALVKSFYSEVDYLAKAGTKCIKASDAFNADKTYVLGENITMDILYNKYYFELSSDENNHSVCNMINYNNHHFLFTGDLEKEGEEELVKYYDGTEGKTLPSHIDLYKGGHHGSKTSSTDELLDKVDPKRCCVCCCAGCTEYTVNRKNTFPTQDFINRIAKHTDEVYVTSKWNEETEIFESMNGNILVSCDGSKIGLAASNNTLKLKETEWFTHLVYVNDKDQIVSKEKSTKQVQCRDMPEAWR